VDISILSKASIKIRSRHAGIIVDPSMELPKISSDAVILLKTDGFDLSRVVDYRIVINGPGEYEISGVKVLGVKGDKGFVYGISADGFSVILGRSSDISKIKEDTYLSQIVILNVDDEINASAVTKLEPKIVILYGENKEAALKILGKANLSPVKKYSTLKDKLPEEMEVILLN